VKKIPFGYGLLAVSLALFVWIWTSIGDLGGAVLSMIVIALFAGLLFAIFAFLSSWLPDLVRQIRGISRDEHLKQLEASGKAVKAEYEMCRALTVEELGTGSVMHLIDLGSDKILCLIGQYYYEFEPINDDPENNQQRRFPTANFSLLRHAKTGEVLSLSPGMNVIEPTVCAPIVWPEQLSELGFHHVDGEIVSGSSMDEVERVVRGAKNQI